MSDSDAGAERSFTFLDASRFPVVRYRIPEAVGHLQAETDPLLRDLDLLLARNLPFILITSGQHDREPADVRKGRAVWFKAHQPRLAGLCRVMIHIAPNPEERHRMIEQTQTLSNTLGMPLFVVSDETEADRRAQSVLSAQLGDEPASTVSTENRHRDD